MPKELLSVVIIAKDAERYLSDCLSSVAFADEIVLLDSGSTDRTCEIAEEYGAKVYSSDDWPGFGIQRQRAQAYASNNWVMMIDVDEQVSEVLKSNILKLLNNPNEECAYSLDRISDFFGRFIKTSGWYPDRVVRLYHKDKFSYDDALVHEKVVCNRKQVREIEGHLYHYTTGTYQEFMTKSLRYANDWAEAKYSKGKRTSLPGILVHAIGTMLVKYILKRGFMDGRHGLLLAWVSGVYTFNKYTALWVKQNKT